MVNSAGYKKTTVASLALLAVAMLINCGAARMVSFHVFLLGSFCTGAALTALQTVVNPYVTVLGSPEGASGQFARTVATATT